MNKNLVETGKKVLLILFGIVFIFFSFGYINSGSKTWPNVEVQVTAVSEAVRTDDTERVEYDITYTYTVDGKSYQDTNSRSTAAALGEKLLVFYNPADPTDTVFSRGDMETWGYGGLALGVGCVGYGLWGLIKGRKPNQDEPAG